jgi:hypothetical protein
MRSLGEKGGHETKNETTKDVEGTREKGQREGGIRKSNRGLVEWLKW